MMLLLYQYVRLFMLFADFEMAAELLEATHAADPHNLFHIDTLSNILYVRDEKPRLAELAREAQVCMT